MSWLVWVITVSGSTLLLLTLLFWFEARRGRRLAIRLRDRLDWLVHMAGIGWHRFMLAIATRLSWVSAYGLVQYVLVGLKALIQSLEQYVAWLQKRNRRMNRSLRAARSETHLSAIAAHKQATALSDSEKATLREKTLAG